MKARHLLSLLLVLTVFATSACRGVQRRHDALVGFNDASWTQLGKRSVRLAGDRDVIPVTIAKGTYRRIMFVVHDSAMEMHDVVVTFANGERFSPSTRLFFAPDSRSRVIDLPGRKRAIRSVEFHYKSKNVLTGRATVELWGKH